MRHARYFQQTAPARACAVSLLLYLLMKLIMAALPG